MSLWRRRAVETFPDLRRELTSADVDSTYSMWALVLLPLAEDAHARDDRSLLGRIYGYAAWSMRQPAKDVWNAAGVCFYEHLFDEPWPEDWIGRVEWVPDDAIARVLGHSSPAITLGTYAHVFAAVEHDDRARERMEAAFGAVLLMSRAEPYCASRRQEVSAGDSET